MARARGIKPGVFNDPDVVELPMAGRWLFVGLWTLADREGRLEDKPRHIKMSIFPCDEVDADALLQQIAAVGLIVRYKVDGVNFIQITGFVKHQSPHRDEKASIIPPPAHLVLPAAAKPTTRKPDAPTPEHDAPTAKHGASTVQARCKHGASLEIAVPCTLTPDCGLLTPDSLMGGETRTLDPDAKAEARIPPPPFPTEYREVIAVERPDLDAPLVWALFAEHYPEEYRSVSKWTKWVRSEFEPKPKAAVPPSTADPDSKASIEALAKSLGMKPWDNIEHWDAFKARVRGKAEA